MLPLNSKKWRNVTLLGFVFFGILLFAEVIPLISKTGDQVVTCVSGIGSGADANELKRELSYEQNNKKQLTALRKSLFSISRESTSGATLIRSIDSLAKKTDCKLLSVIPLPPKEKQKNEIVELRIQAEYNELYNLVRCMKNLPVLFSITELQYGAEDDKGKALTARFRIELMTGGGSAL